MNADTMRTIETITPLGGAKLRLKWSDGTIVELTMPQPLDPADAQIGEWGHCLIFPNGDEIGADSLWRQSLDSIGRSDARQFLEWRLENGLSLSKAADALGLARRTVAYYSNGERPVPKTVLLACKGWVADQQRRAA